jgi:O-antigen ligase
VATNRGKESGPFGRCNGVTTLFEHATTPKEVPASARRSLDLGQLLEHAAVVLLMLWWAGPMTRAQGGRGPGATAWALALLVPALLLTRAWSRVSAVLLIAAWAVPLGALAMCLLAPSGWNGADDLASYTLASLLVPVIVAYGRTPERRSALVAAIVLAGMVEFAEAFLPWWGGGNPAVAMIGTFFWWNPYAAFLLPGALLGAALVIGNRTPWRLVGWASAPLCVAGIVFSSSRATLALLVLGLLLTGLVCLAFDGRRRALARWLGVAVLSVAVCIGVSGPPFFEHRGSLTSTEQAKAARGESVAQNSTYRLQFWQRSVEVFVHHPLAGAGSHTLVEASAPYVPVTFARSNLVHNGYLQALSDGGLLLGLPFLASWAAVLLAACRLLLSIRRRADERWLRMAAPLALVLSAAHSGVDFDWSHPSDLVLTALLAALVLGVPVSRTETAPRRSRRRWVVTALVAVPMLLAGTAAVAVVRWHQTPGGITRLRLAPPARAAALRAEGSGLFRDFRWPVALLVTATGTEPLVRDTGVAHPDLQWALERTAREASIDPSTALLRARGLLVLGRTSEAVAVVEQNLARLTVARSGSIADQASAVLASAGDTKAARSVLLPYLAPDARDVHLGEHVHALLVVDAPAFTELDRCAFSLLANDAVPAGTPDPGPPSSPTACVSLLRGTS